MVISYEFILLQKHYLWDYNRMQTKAKLIHTHTNTFKTLSPRWTSCLLRVCVCMVHTACNVSQHEWSHLLIHIALNGVMVTDVNLVQVNGVINVGPHVVIILDMMFKPLCSTLELVARKTTYEAHSSRVLLGAKLQQTKYHKILSLLSYQGNTLTLSSLSSEKVSTMIPNTMLRPMVVTMMKKEIS